MKLKAICWAAVSLGILGVGLTGCKTEGHDQATLMASAKISRAEAEKIALSQVPGGTIKEGELEKEKGKLIWSFDVATPGTSDITEVHLDAITGAVAGIEKESAEKERKEK